MDDLVNHYEIELVDYVAVARIYVDGKKTSAYTTVIPDHLKDVAKVLQDEEDMKPF